MGVKWGNDECGALEPGGGGGKTRVAEAGRDWPRKGGSPVDGSGQEEPKRDESPKDQSDTRCISRERSCHRDDVLRLEFGAGRGRGKVTDVTPGGHRSIGTYRSGVR